MSNCSEKNVDYFAGLFKTLGDPSRLIIFLRLASCCTPEMQCEISSGWRECIGELSKDLGLAPSTISHHVKKLFNSGLIKMERRGKQITCWADPETLKALREFIAAPPSC
jgi:ArsR family transcriptional regulator